MQHFKQMYGLSFGYALMVHIVVFFLLFFSFSTNHKKALVLPTVDIVQAIVLDENQVQAQVDRLEKVEKQENQKKIDDQKRLEALQLEIQKQEKTKLDQIKQRQVEESDLAKIQLAKEKEQKALETLRAQKAKEEKQLAALEDKRLEDQERANQMRLEREKEEKKKKDKLEAKRKLEEEKKLADMQAAEAAALAAENARQQAGLMIESDQYKTKMREKIRSQWIRPDGLPPGLKCILGIKALPDGSIQEIRILQSSGNLAFDQTAKEAVRKAEPLPFPSGNPPLGGFFRDFALDFVSDEEVIRHEN